MSLAQALTYAEDTKWLTRKEAATLLTKIGCPTSTDMLARWRDRPCPPHIRFRKQIRYSRDEVIAWAQRQMQKIGH